MTERGYRIVGDVNKEGWEKSNFPTLCETCLGDNPYVRMQKEDYGVECKICQRPFTIFRWKAGTNGRYKATVVCQSCARMKNVCQTCLFDLEYGLPVQVRDQFLEEQGQDKIALPESKVGRDFAIQELARKSDDDLPYGKAAKHPMLQRLARMTPYYKRNEARICTFYVKGACNRGQDCPFRHELPEGGELANQRLRDRFHGENDVLAKKIMRKGEEDFTLQPPEDRAITTLYVGGLPPGTKQKEVREQFYVHGEVSSIRMVPKQSCAFVTFATREMAEAAASAMYRLLELGGKKVQLMWARPSQGAQAGSSSDPAGAATGAAQQPAGTTERPYYASMDPGSMGNDPLEGQQPDTMRGGVFRV